MSKREERNKAAAENEAVEMDLPEDAGSRTQGGSCAASLHFEARMELKPSVLYLVSVPIGNLDDFTFRALHVLRHADYIACEEVQSARRLLKTCGIEGKLISYRESGREQSGSRIIELLRQGFNVAVVSGAGTPAISDPGRDLVCRCHQAGFRVSPIPGASALTAAAASSGLPSRRFAFEGFLPRKDSDRDRFLDELAGEERTMIFFEAPHRLLSSLRSMRASFGPREAFIGRELTKFFEECTCGTLDGFIADYAEREPKGEFVIVVSGAERDEAEEKRRLNSLLAEDAAFLKDMGLSGRSLAEILIRFRNIPKNQAKQIAMQD